MLAEVLDSWRGRGRGAGLYPKTNFNLILLEVLATSNNADHSSPKALSFLCFQDSTTSSVPSSHCLSWSSLWYSLPMSSLLIIVSQGSALFPLPLGDPTLQPFIFNCQVYTATFRSAFSSSPGFQTHISSSLLHTYTCVQ